MKSPAERESVIAGDIELFAARLTLRAWNWRNIDPWQRELLKSEDRYIHVNCSRQSGKSSSLSVKAFHKMLVKDGALVLIIAEQRQSNEDIRKVKELASVYDRIIREKYDNQITLDMISDNVTSVEFPNKSRCISLPANEKIRGYSAPDIVWIDEAHYVDDKVFQSVEPMIEVSPEGQLIMSSTPNAEKGREGFFFFESGNPRYKHFKVPWNQCPRISEESIKEKRMIYGEAYVQTEYECAFTEGGSALFTEQALKDSFDETEDVFSNTMQAIQDML
jgi:hypothetical protein